MAWYLQDNASEDMARFCAPKVLSTLLDCSTVEASALLLEEGLQGRSFGSVDSHSWHKWLKEELGGVSLSTRRPDGNKRWSDAWKRYDQRVENYAYGPYPRVPAYTDSFQYTVAQYLRIQTRGTIVLSIGSHTLLAQDGEVIADTQRSKSQRGRVRRATLLPECFRVV